ncbi:MAG TPA: carboxypeptidase regulatory-like domain-containing protein [Terriglobales bacterium]|nr:carboxypeptidase regulatory-like domain-containing protein [Terriglobales bacterium]
MRKRALAVISGSLILAIGLGAQNINATLTGTVKDTSGAVIPGVTVHLRDNATGQTRSIVTDASGAYALALLPAGTYTVTASKPGFQQFSSSNVVLHVGEHRGFDITLQPGAVTQTVTVSSTAAPVQTATPAQSTTITGSQIRELQLNNRNFEQLVTLQPGVSSSLPAIIGFGIQNTSSVSVDGARPTANNWTVDGADINDSGSNATLTDVPSVDALAEFTTNRSTYDAQYGRSGGGQITVVTRSGTNVFHGTAYEFVRNTKLNANDFFANAAGLPRAAFHYNDFGYTIGGPIRKDKIFFFWSQEWRKTNTPITETADLPTPAELSGDFTGIATLDPTLAPPGCVVGDTIAPACFSTNAKVYLNHVFSTYTANLPATNQLVTSPTQLANTRQELIRLDDQLTGRVRLFARYMQADVPTTEAGGLFDGNPLPGLAATATNAPARNMVAHMSAVISPTVVNELAFNYAWGAINSANTGRITDPAFYNALDLAAFPFADPYRRVPNVTFSSPISGQAITGVTAPSAPYHERNIDKELYDNLSWVAGNHTLRTGVDAQWMRKTENGPLATNGSFVFRDTQTTPPAFMPAFAEFLLGQAYQYTQANRDIIPDLRYVNLGIYVQDDWKVRPNFTLNLGLRYSLLPPPEDVTGTLSSFDPERFNPALAPPLDANGNFAAGSPADYLNGIIIGGSGSSQFGPATISPYGYRVNPVAYDNFGPRVGFAWDPFGTGRTAVRAGYGIYYDRTLNGIWEQNTFANPPFVNTLNVFGPAVAASTATNFFDDPVGGVAAAPAPRNLHATGDPLFPTPYIQNYSVSVEREIGASTVVQAAWVGAKGTHLLGIADENIPTLAARAAAPAAPVNAVRPFGGYGAISVLLTGYDSTYNSLQLSLERRVARGLNLGLAYTWAKELTNNPSDRSSAVYDPYQPSLDRGPASFIRPNVFVANYVYDLPFFADQQGAVGRLLGGWEISGITTLEQGFPLTVTQSDDPFNLGDFPACPANCFPGGIGIDQSPVIAPRPDLTGPIVLPQTATEWVSPSAFTPAVGHFGTAGRGLFLGPGLSEWDFALFKNFKVTERLNAQLRGEFFNLFNQVSLNNPTTNSTSSRFGRITSDRSPRVVQLGLKLNF